MFKKIIAFFISFCFAFEQIGFAQIAGQLDISGRMSSLIGSVVYENYRPMHLRYLSYDQLNNDFKLLLDKGSAKEAKPAVLENTASDLLQYFFVGITLPDDAFWVNLRPDSPKEMINDDLAKTDMGKIMLEADLQLKKDTAKYTSPETFEGREYWDKLYKRAEELYGSENITIPTLTRPWIVPDEIIVREAQGSAYIYKATLKVMLEQDYLKGNANYRFPDEKSKILNEYSSQIIRETIIPKITREINSSKRYAPLRQVYYSLILAQWFKQSHKDKRSQVASKIDTKDLSNLVSKAKWDKGAYFKAYQKSFKDGEYNIRENRQSAYGQTIRTYFSGGEQFADIGRLVEAALIHSNFKLDSGFGSKLWSQYYALSVSPEGGITIEKNPEPAQAGELGATNNPVTPATQARKNTGESFAPIVETSRFAITVKPMPYGKEHKIALGTAEMLRRLIVVSGIPEEKIFKIVIGEQLLTTGVGEKGDKMTILLSLAMLQKDRENEFSSPEEKNQYLSDLFDDVYEDDIDEGSLGFLLGHEIAHIQLKEKGLLLKIRNMLAPSFNPLMRQVEYNADALAAQYLIGLGFSDVAAIQERAINSERSAFINKGLPGNLPEFVYNLPRPIRNSISWFITSHPSYAQRVERIKKLAPELISSTKPQFVAENFSGLASFWAKANGITLPEIESPSAQKDGGVRPGNDFIGAMKIFSRIFEETGLLGIEEDVVANSSDQELYKNRVFMEKESGALTEQGRYLHSYLLNCVRANQRELKSIRQSDIIAWLNQKEFQDFIKTYDEYAGKGNAQEQARLRSVIDNALVDIFARNTDAQKEELKNRVLDGIDFALLAGKFMAYNFDVPSNEKQITRKFKEIMGFVFQGFIWAERSLLPGFQKEPLSEERIKFIVESCIDNVIEDLAQERKFEEMRVKVFPTVSKFHDYGAHWNSLAHYFEKYILDGEQGFYAQAEKLAYMKMLPEEKWMILRQALQPKIEVLAAYLIGDDMNLTEKDKLELIRRIGSDLEKYYYSSRGNNPAVLPSGNRLKIPLLSGSSSQQDGGQSVVQKDIWALSGNRILRDLLRKQLETENWRKEIARVINLENLLQHGIELVVAGTGAWFLIYGLVMPVTTPLAIITGSGIIVAGLALWYFNGKGAGIELPAEQWFDPLYKSYHIQGGMAVPELLREFLSALERDIDTDYYKQEKFGRKMHDKVKQRYEKLLAALLESYGGKGKEKENEVIKEFIVRLYRPRTEQRAGDRSAQSQSALDLLHEFPLPDNDTDKVIILGLRSLSKDYLSAFDRLVTNCRKDNYRFSGADGDIFILEKLALVDSAGNIYPAVSNIIKSRLESYQPAADIREGAPAEAKVIPQKISGGEGIASLTKIEAASDDSFVDLKQFINAMNLLVNKNLSPEVINSLLKELKLDSNLSEEEAYKTIIENLAAGKLSKPIIQKINRDTYSDVRLEDVIGRQSSYPMAQGVYEAVANSLDALGFDIGQFGKGVKQILAWLDSNSQDKIEVLTRAQGESPYKLELVRDTAGDIYVKINKISLAEFQQTVKSEGFGETEKGTLVRVLTQKAIPLKDEDPTAIQGASQEAIASGIHKIFPFVYSVDITTQIGDNPAVEVNGFKNKVRVVPASGTVSDSEVRTRGRIHVRLTDHSIAIMDDGKGMGGQPLARMFVPGAGDKNKDKVEGELKPVSLSQDQLEEKLKKASVVHDSKMPHRVSFARNGRVLTTVDIPESVVEEAAAPGGLMIDLGSIMEVPESWDSSIMSVNTNNQQTDFQRAVEYTILRIIEHPQLSDAEKLQYINTIIIGLEGLIQGNSNYAHVIKAIRSQAQQAISPVVEKLRRENYIILPHGLQFSKIAVPSQRKVLFIHEKLFDWKGAESLKEIGGQRVPGVVLDGEGRLPLVIVPFTAESLAGIRSFDRRWALTENIKRLPVIRTDRFIAIPQELGTRLLQLTSQKTTGLTAQEKRELKSLLQLVNILTARQVVTSYEITAPPQNLVVEETARITASSGQIDSRAINDFLKTPPFSRSVSSIPGAKRRFFQRGEHEFIELGTGKKISWPMFFSVEDIEYSDDIGNGYFWIATKDDKEYLLQYDPDRSALFIPNFVDIKTFQAVDHRKGSKFLVVRQKSENGGNRDLILNCETGEIQKVWGTEDGVALSSRYEFSEDGKHLVYSLVFAEKDPSFLPERRIIVFDLEKGKIKLDAKLPGIPFSRWDSPEEPPFPFIRINNSRNAVEVIDGSVEYSSGSQEYFIDLETNGPVWKSDYELIHDDSGVYSLMVGNDGETRLLIRGQKEALIAKDFGVQGEIISAETIWIDSVTYYRVWIRENSGKTTAHFFDKENLNKLPRITLPHCIQKIAFVEEGGNIRGNSQFLGLNPEAVPSKKWEKVIAEEKDSERPHKVPGFNLIQHNTLLLDSQTGEALAMIPSTAKVLYYNKLRGVIGYEYGGLLYEEYIGKARDQTKVQYWVDSSRKYFVFNALGHYAVKEIPELTESGESQFIVIRDSRGEKISAEKYTQIEQDGDHLVFIDPNTGEAVYLDPRDPNAAYVLGPDSKMPQQKSLSNPDDLDQKALVISTKHDVENQYDAVFKHHNKQIDKDVALVAYDLLGKLAVSGYTEREELEIVRQFRNIARQMFDVSGSPIEFVKEAMRLGGTDETSRIFEGVAMLAEVAEKIFREDQTRNFSRPGTMSYIGNLLEEATKEYLQIKKDKPVDEKINIVKKYLMSKSKLYDAPFEGATERFERDVRMEKLMKELFRLGKTRETELALLEDLWLLLKDAGKDNPSDIGDYASSWAAKKGAEYFVKMGGDLKALALIVFAGPESMRVTAILTQALQHYYAQQDRYYGTPQPKKKVLATAEEAQLWQKVLSSRDKFISQARASYGPLLKIIPEERRPEIERILLPLIESLYRKQEAEINKKFLDRINNPDSGEIDLAAATLPFDVFSGNIQKILPVLSAHINSLKLILDQERNAVQADFYNTLFRNIFELAIQEDVQLKKLDQEFLEILGYGWSAQSQQQLEAIELIGTLINGIKTAQNGQTEINTIKNIVSLLSYFGSKDPAKNIPVLTKQVGRIFKLKPEARNKVLAELGQVFENARLEDLKKFLDSPEADKLSGPERDFAVFLTNEVEQVRKQQRVVFEGIEEYVSEHGVWLSQLIKLNQQRSKQGEKDMVIGIEEMVRAVRDSLLPEPSDLLEGEILKNIRVQRESGASAGETAQNSKDGTRGTQGELVLGYYLQEGLSGEQESVEEAADNGTGALEEVALLIPMSTKAQGGQVDLAGFFGTGKYTIFEGVDRLEIITKNNSRAYLFGFSVIRDAQGKPVAVKLTRIQKITDPKLNRGVTIRRIKSLERTIPELDQMLSKRSWKTFAGLSQDGNFKIYFIDYEGKKQPLIVEHQVLSEIEFTPAKKKEADHPALRIISTKDMPLQVVDKAGLRVSEIKERYLELIPESLRHHLKDLGIVIQIPLPLIRNRSGFEHEDKYLPEIQKYVAIAFYKAIVYKTLTQTSPQFVFEGLPLDWETNDDYWDSIDTYSDSPVINLGARINREEYAQISLEDLKSILPAEGKLDYEKKFLKLMLILETLVSSGGSESKTSLLLRRLAIQQEINRQRSEAQKKSLARSGAITGVIPEAKDVPNYQKKINESRGIQTAHEQIRTPEKYVVSPDNYSDAEKDLVRLAYSIAGNFGIEQVVLLDERVSFAGAFKIYQGKHTMFLARSLAREMIRAGKNDEVTDTIVHELAHLLERFIRQDNLESKLWQEGFVSHVSNFTHDSMGPFAEAMKYISAVYLANSRPEDFQEIGQNAAVDSGKATAQKDGGSIPGDTENPNVLLQAVEGIHNVVEGSLIRFFDSEKRRTVTVMLTEDLKSIIVSDGNKIEKYPVVASSKLIMDLDTGSWVKNNAQNLLDNLSVLAKIEGRSSTLKSFEADPIPQSLRGVLKEKWGVLPIVLNQTVFEFSFLLAFNPDTGKHEIVMQKEEYFVPFDKEGVLASGISALEKDTGNLNIIGEGHFHPWGMPLPSRTDMETIVNRVKAGKILVNVEQGKPFDAKTAEWVRMMSRNRVDPARSSPEEIKKFLKRVAASASPQEIIVTAGVERAVRESNGPVINSDNVQNKKRIFLHSYTLIEAKSDELEAEIKGWSQETIAEEEILKFFSVEKFEIDTDKNQIRPLEPADNPDDSNAQKDGGKNEVNIDPAAVDRAADLLSQGDFEAAAKLLLSDPAYRKPNTPEQWEAFLVAVRNKTKVDSVGWTKFTYLLAREEINSAKKEIEELKNQVREIEKSDKDISGQPYYEKIKTAVSLNKESPGDRNTKLMIGTLEGLLSPETLRGGVKFAPEKFSVKEVIEQGVETAKADARKLGIPLDEVEINIEGDAEVTTYRSELRNISHNYVLNGLKYRKTENVPKYIKLIINKDVQSGLTAVTYEDNGQGMDEKNKNRFLTGEGDLPETSQEVRYNRSGQGTGIVLGALAALGGKYLDDFETQLGRGTRFSIGFASEMKKTYSGDLSQVYTSIKHDIENVLITPVIGYVFLLKEKFSQNTALDSIETQVSAISRVLKNLAIIIAKSDIKKEKIKELITTVSARWEGQSSLFKPALIKEVEKLDPDVCVKVIGSLIKEGELENLLAIILAQVDMDDLSKAEMIKSFIETLSLKYSSGQESETSAKDGGKQTTLDQFDAQDMIDRLEVIPLTGKMSLISKTGEVLAIIESRKGRLKNALRLEFNRYDPQFIVDNKAGLLEQVLKIAALVDIRHLALKGGEEYNRNFTQDVLKISDEENIRTILSRNPVFVNNRRLGVDNKGKPVLLKDGGNPVSSQPKEGAETKNPLGGVDFRGLPIVTQPGVMAAGLNQLPAVNIADLDGEWQQIEKMAATEIVPSTQRLKEFLGACCSKGALNKYAGNVLACIADILRMEEEKAQATEPALKEILILLESNRPENELQQSLSFIAVTAGQPQA